MLLRDLQVLLVPLVTVLYLRTDFEVSSLGT